MSTPTTLAVLLTAVLAGALTGVTGHTLTRATTDSATPPSGAPSTSRPRSTGAPASPFLGAGNVLATGDFASLGWRDVALDGEGNGEPQFTYSCQRRALTDTGYPMSVISANWTRQNQLSGAETVAQLTNSPQTRPLFVTLTRWYDHCTTASNTSGRPTPSKRLDTVESGHGVARIWRVTDIDEQHPTYAIVARAGDRVCLIDLYTDGAVRDPTGLPRLARRAIARLG